MFTKGKMLVQNQRSVPLTFATLAANGSVGLNAAEDEWKGKPASIRCDNGPEYAGNRLIMWAERRNITLNFIQPGKPQQNAYIERYNRTVRYDWLVQHRFYSLSELQEYVIRLEKAPQGAFSLLLL